MVRVDLAKLVALREDAKFTISFVSDELGYKTPTGYWLVENGQRKVNVDVLYKLSKLYNISINDLLTEDV